MLTFAMRVVWQWVTSRVSFPASNVALTACDAALRPSKYWPVIQPAWLVLLESKVKIKGVDHAFAH